METRHHCVWIDTDIKMNEATENIGNSSIICVDTEYDSFRYFREVLCLIQIDAGGRTYLFDPLGKPDLSFLGTVFEDPAVLKIMHAGDNDIRLLKRDYSFEFVNIFDTHQAASILGCHHLSLSTLISQYLCIELKKDKKMQRSKWEARPLTEGQIHYAVEDTAHLTALYLRLDAEIRLRGLERKAAKAFEKIAAVTWSEKSFNPHACKGLKGYDSLSAQQKHYLMNLYSWRFRKAKKTNMARFRILTDQALLDLARSEASSMEMLRKTEILSPEKIRLYGREIIEAVSSDRGSEQNLQ
ncbi:MAG: ribonuclease D [Syntrophales bacterium]